MVSRGASEEEEEEEEVEVVFFNADFPRWAAGEHRPVGCTVCRSQYLDFGGPAKLGTRGSEIDARSNAMMDDEVVQMALVLPARGTLTADKRQPSALFLVARYSLAIRT